MCVTKKKQKNVQSTRVIGVTTDSATGVSTPGMTPVSASTTAESNKKVGSKKLPVAKIPSKESDKGRVKSDVEAKKSEDQNEKVSELRKIADRVTEMPRGPPVAPPKKLQAKRQIKGHRDSKDPEYVTLDNDFPKFEEAKLKGFSREKDGLKIETTQPSSNDEKKQSGEKEE